MFQGLRRALRLALAHHLGMRAVPKLIRVASGRTRRRWSDRGPRPENGEMPKVWKGATWRPGAKRWVKRGGREVQARRRRQELRDLLAFP